MQRRAPPPRDGAATTTICWELPISWTVGAVILPDRRPGRPGSYVTLHRSSMHVVLLRPVPGNDRFGLGPFFRIEPLGMEYIASALEARGHTVTLVDLRFSRSLDYVLRSTRFSFPGSPGLVGIAAMHALETDDVMALARRV